MMESAPHRRDPVEPTFGSGRSARQVTVHLALIVLATALAFGNTLHSELHLDDAYRVANNPELDRVWPPWRHFVDPRTSSTIPQIEQYRPLLPLSLSVNKATSRLIGLDVLTGYHLGNIAIHLLTCLLLYGLFFELLRHPAGRPGTRGRDAAFWGTLLFAVHPVSGVPVNYISARDLLLMLCLLVGSLLVYVRMRRTGDSPGGWASSLGLLALSLLAKPNSVMAPALVLGFELLLAHSPRRAWSTWARPLAFLGVVAGFFVWTEVVLGFSDLEQVTSETRSPWIYASTQLRAHLDYYLRNAVWPFRLRPMPAIGEAHGPLDPGVIAGGLVVVSSLLWAVVLARRAPVASVGILAYWILFIPTSSIRPLYDLVTDYRQYPSLPFLTLVATLAAYRFARPRVAATALGAVAVYLVISSVVMNGIWRTDETFSAQSVRYGAAPLGHMNYARAVQDRDPALAERHYQETLRVAPEHTYTHINLGMLYLSLGRTDEGLTSVERAVELAPSWGITHFWLASAYRQAGRLAEAQAASRRAADLDPRNVEYQYQAAYDLQQRGDYAASLPYLERVRRVSPDHELTRFLEGFAFQRLGRWPEAEASYRAFLEQRPRYAQAWFNPAHGLMTEGRHAEAIPAFEQALRFAPRNYSAHHWLAESHRALGDTEAADRHAALYSAAAP